jgi:lysophospholipid hydrolase
MISSVATTLPTCPSESFEREFSPASSDRFFLGILGMFCHGVFGMLWQATLQIINWVAIYLPTMIINALSTNFQISLSLSSILIFLAGIVGFCFLIVRYKYLTRYSEHTRISDGPNTTKTSLDIVDSLTNKKNSKKKSSSNYLDEFLGAIKVFGYLERPVFHELTKNMTTQKLASDEILYLDEKLGFSIVVEGTIQVYTKIRNDKMTSESSFDVDDDENELNYEKGDMIRIGNQRYQLLNEVKSGSPLSSLISTLDLFKPMYPEPVKLREFELGRPGGYANGPERVYGRELASREFDRVNFDRVRSPLTVSPFDDLLNENDTDDMSDKQEDIDENIRDQYPDIIARPKPLENCEHHLPHGATIAIIPHLAFRKVHTKYPKATSHIVTMVLTRLYKVTMNTIHNYLGLTREIIESEILLNKSNGESTIPRYLLDGIVKKLYQADTTMTPSVSTSSISIPRLSKKNALSKTPPALASTPSSRYVVLDSRSKSTHPGDLLSSVPLSRRSDYYQTHTQAPESEREERDGPRTSCSKFTGASISTIQRSASQNSSEPLVQSLASNLRGIHLLPSNLTTRKSFKAKPTLLHRENSKIEDIRDRSFSDEREETEDTSLRIAIIESIFKLLGIDEHSSLLKDIRDLNSGQSSVNSSSVGLSSLMEGGNHKFDMNSKLDSVSSRLMNSDSMTRLDASFLSDSNSSSTPLKFFNTINQVDLKQTNPHALNTSNLLKLDRSRSSSIKPHALNFTKIKYDFAKALDIKYVPPNTTIVKQGTYNSGLYYVIDGTLDVLYLPVNVSNPVTKKLYSVELGGIAGYLTSVVGFRSLVSIKSSKEKGVIVAHISKTNFSKLMDKYFFLLLPVATKLKDMLTPQILTIDFALEWCHIPAGNVLCSQGDLANGFHIVLSGRFRAIRDEKERRREEYERIHEDVTDRHSPDQPLIDDTNNPSKKVAESKILGEYGHGESIGEVEVLTASRRTNSLIAVRDSETARIPRTLFEMLSLQNPSLMVKVSRIVASKVLKSSDNSNSPTSLVSSSTSPHISNEYKTITILPTVSGLPVREFADKLVHALKSIGRSVIALDQASTLTHLGRHAFDERLAHLKLSGYFAYLEEEYDTIVYVCDTQLKSNWTSTCISQGDCILLLADADDDVVATGVGDYERMLIKFKTTARTDLCLIHSEKYVSPGSTSIWLKNRLWVQGHHHIQMEIPRSTEEKKRVKGNIITDLAAKLGNNPNIKLRFETVKSRAINSISQLRVKREVPHFTQSHKNDFLRLARILSNEAVGLVLGGGGSRGISHVGVVTALEKHGIPVDLIGGTSIGSFVGGLYAKEYNIVRIYGRAKKFSKRVASLWRSIFDLTYPVTSYITGYEFNRGIWKTFGSNEIEDFWIKYFCNSTNITNSTMDIHETGYAWRFIRASMSLAGLLPPIAFKGCMLLDGGYIDNLPVMEMKKKGAKYIIAVDVGSVDDRTPMNYGDTLSGFWVLFNRWNPFSKHPNVPNMMDIQMRLAYVASVNALEAAKRTPGVIYLRPPIDNYATLDFGKFDEIYHVGLDYADKLFRVWEEKGMLPDIAGMVNKTNFVNGEERRPLYRRNSI